MSNNDIDQARRWAQTAASAYTSEEKKAYAALATTWAYIAWVDKQTQ